MNTLLIWGAHGHALVVADIVRLRGDYVIVGFFDNVNPVQAGTTIHGVPVLGGKGTPTELRQFGAAYVLFGFGNNAARMRLSSVVQSAGLALASAAIHPRATVADDVTVGAGTIIAAGAVVNPGAQIGQNVIINTCASVDHECVIEDGAHVGPGVHIGGAARVGVGAWVGIGASISDHVSIGCHAVIGAGAVVLNDVPDSVVAYGVPARTIRRA